MRLLCQIVMVPGIDPMDPHTNPISAQMRQYVGVRVCKSVFLHVGWVDLCTFEPLGTFEPYVIFARHYTAKRIFKSADM